MSAGDPHRLADTAELRGARRPGGGCIDKRLAEDAGVGATEVRLAVCVALTEVQDDRPEHAVPYELDLVAVGLVSHRAVLLGRSVTHRWPRLAWRGVPSAAAASLSRPRYPP